MGRGGATDPFRMEEEEEEEESVDHHTRRECLVCTLKPVARMTPMRLAPLEAARVASSGDMTPQTLTTRTPPDGADGAEAVGEAEEQVVTVGRWVGYGDKMSG